MAKVGRPSVITAEVIRKLEEAFSLGCTDLEACLYADISKTALYEYQKDNSNFAERKEKLKEAPILLARKTIINSLNNPLSAQWYLERKKKDEFSTRSELVGKDNKDLIPTPILGDLYVPINNRNQEDSQAIEADTSSAGRDESIEDNLDTPTSDSGSTERQDPDLN